MTPLATTTNAPLGGAFGFRFTKVTINFNGLRKNQMRRLTAHLGIDLPEAAWRH